MTIVNTYWLLIHVLQDYYGGAEGGALFNRGDVTVDGDATFLDNYGGVSKEAIFRSGQFQAELWKKLAMQFFLGTANTPSLKLAKKNTRIFFPGTRSGARDLCFCRGRSSFSPRVGTVYSY